jgi:hypothetical protein
MKSKPILIVAATFAIVLLGGVAMAGVGTTLPASDASISAPSGALEASSATSSVAEDVAVAIAEPPTTTTAVTRTSSPKADSAPDTEDTTEAPLPKEKAPVDESPVTKNVADDPATEGDEKGVPVTLFTIAAPTDGSTFTSKVVTFSGTVEDGVSVHRGKYVADAGDGEWSMQLVLSPGKNRVAFKGISEAGTVSEAAVTVYYDAPVVEEPPKEAAAVEFVANQTYGSCGEDIPYDVFFGTAAPGATVKATSPYGSGVTTANGQGHWEMKVKFPNAPTGETFTVKLTTSLGQSRTFSFVSTRETGDSEKDG